MKLLFLSVGDAALAPQEGRLGFPFVSMLELRPKPKIHSKLYFMRFGILFLAQLPRQGGSWEGPDGLAHLRMRGFGPALARIGRGRRSEVAEAVPLRAVHGPESDRSGPELTAAQV